MTTNTIKHISDLSKYKDFDPTGTAFDPGVTNVQQALGLLSPDGVNGVPQATVSIAGKARLATQQEVDDGISGDTIVTPATLKSRMNRPEASETVLGVTQYATNSEAITGTANNRTIVASALKAVLDNTFTVRVSTETSNGVIKLSTTPAAVAGVDDTTAMTPLKVKQAIVNATNNIPTYGSATQDVAGIVRIATPAQGYAGVLHDGYALSPRTLFNMPSTEAAKGVIKLATQLEMNSGTVGVAVDAQKFVSTRASTSRVGTTILANQLGDANTALSGTAAVLASDRATITYGGVFENNTNAENRYLTRGSLKPYLPVGSIIMTAFYYDQGNVLMTDGRWVSRWDWPELFSVIGYTFGGDGGTYFALPDTRGVFPRGFDPGRGLDPGRAIGSYQEDTQQRLTAGWAVDDSTNWSNYPPQGCTYADEFGTVNYDVGFRIDKWFGGKMHFDSARQARTSHENRPKNVSLGFGIIAR